MRRFELTIKRGSYVETKYMRAINMSSVVAEAEDLIKGDYRISNIIVTNLVTNETVVVR